jgi:hypothetical protein
MGIKTQRRAHGSNAGAFGANDMLCQPSLCLFSPKKTLKERTKKDVTTTAKELKKTKQKKN